MNYADMQLAYHSTDNAIGMYQCKGKMGGFLGLNRTGENLNSRVVSSFREIWISRRSSIPNLNSSDFLSDFNFSDHSMIVIAWL